jgi:tRNA pseudouridine(38-40) synthase
MDEFTCKALIEDRDWPVCRSIWQRCIADPDWTPDFIRGNEDYGITELSRLSYEGSTYVSKDRRKTFAMRIGYIGDRYNGFQRQAGIDGVYTVEDDLLQVIGKPSVAAGRTDKNVSALSQVVSFHTHEEGHTVEFLRMRFKAFESHHFRLMECHRVPRKFHALFLATWRRYIYLVPLKGGPYGGHDIDVGFVHDSLKHLEGTNLSYKALEIKGTSKHKEDTKDHGYNCTLIRAQARYVLLQDVNFCGFEFVGNRFLRHMVRTLVVNTHTCLSNVHINSQPIQ